MSYASQISTARNIARAAEQKIQVRTGMQVTLVMCPGKTETTRKSPEQMLQIIAGALNMSIACFQDRTRNRNVVEMRFLAALLLRRFYPGITLKQIALLFGGQDHTSVMNALIRANDLLDIHDTLFTSKYNKALNTINQWLKEQ